MCPEWWLHKGVLNLISMLKLCLGFLVDTLFCVKWLARLSIFIHADILVLVSEFVVVVILSEQWLLPTSVGILLVIVYCIMYVKVTSTYVHAKGFTYK